MTTAAIQDFSSLIDSKMDSLLKDEEIISLINHPFSDPIMVKCTIYHYLVSHYYNDVDDYEVLLEKNAKKFDDALYKIKPQMLKNIYTTHAEGVLNIVKQIIRSKREAKGHY